MPNNPIVDSKQINKQSRNQSSSQKVRIEIYTDGACSGNPGPGGYGILIRFPDYPEIEVVRKSRGFPNTTNNKMELMGVIEALKMMPTKYAYSVDIYTDSQYVANGYLKGWVKSWKAYGWRKRDGTPVKNVEMWKELDALVIKCNPVFHWVKGHANNPFNNECDALARAAILSLS